jgi:adenylate cyclase
MTSEEIQQTIEQLRKLVNTSHYYEAKAFAFELLEVQEIQEDVESLAKVYGNLGIAFEHLSDYPKALENYEKALQKFEEIGNIKDIATNLGNIGNVYCNLSDFTKALEYYEKALQINEQIARKSSIAINFGNISNVYSELADYARATEYLNIAFALSNEIGDRKFTLHLLKEYSELYEKMGDIDIAFTYYKQYIELKDEIQSEETTKKALQFDQQRKIEEDRKARELKLARLQEQEKILHNILPVKIADRILQQDTFIADHFESVSVMFMDIVGFTSLSSIAPPKHLVFLLDAIFQKAGDVLEQFGLEKIKTIGDGYLAVANITSPLEEHQKATAQAALQLLETIRDFTVNIPKDLGSTEWINNMNDIEIRIGIHTGEVVAGIIGKNKYTFDLWGDAVNVASRMESHSEPWKIHVSDQFAKSIESNAEFKIIPRGEISIKGKGTMNTYWLEKAI